MKRINKAFYIAILIVVTIVLSSIISFAAPSFTDVSEDHWAYNYIEKMKDKGIISGYFDATFRPNQNVTKIETLIMIYNMLNELEKVDTNNINDLVLQYNNILTENNIPDWSKKQVAYALDNDIVNDDELESFIKSSMHSKANRSEVAIFLGRTLNQYLKRDLDNKVLLLGFKDENEIPDEARKYVYLLKAEGIVQGDLENKFNPNDPIMRAAAATMLSKTYDYLLDLEDSSDNTSDNEDTDEQNTGNIEIDSDWDNEDLTYKEVTIKFIVDNTKSIFVEDSSNDEDLYSASDARIVIDGIISKLEDLKTNDKVKLYFDDDDKLVKIVKSQNVNIFEGEVVEVNDIGYTYIVSVIGKDNRTEKTYGIKGTTKVVLDGKNAEITDLKPGDSVVLEINRQDIEKIIAESSSRVYEGVLIENPILDEFYKIRIETFAGKIYELELDEDVDIEKNDRDKSIKDLFEGDIVTVRTRQNKAISIEAISVETETEGTIKSISIGDESTITIKDEDGKEKTYTISPDTEIEIDNRDASIYELKLKYYVELELESNVVTKIEAEEIETSDKLMGVITKIYEGDEAIRVKVGTGNDATYYDIKADDATIISENLDETRFSSLEEDFEVVVYGEESNGVFDFVAEKILIMKIN